MKKHDPFFFFFLGFKMILSMLEMKGEKKNVCGDLKGFLSWLQNERRKKKVCVCVCGWES